MKPNIELFIEELVLHGFDHIDRYCIGTAVKREFLRLLIKQDVPSLLANSGKYAQMDGGAFEAMSGTNSEFVGTRIAQAIFKGLAR